MKKLNVTKTRELDLCVSCEICSAVCPEGAILIEYKFGQFLPKVDDEKCINCGLCLEICPGIDLDFPKLDEKNSENLFDGTCLESYTAYSKNFKIRKNSSSGGLITNLIIELIKNKEFDAAFVLHFDKFDFEPARLKVTNKINEILSSSKSKYIPASVYNVIKTLQRNDSNKKYIIVGTPCQIYGIKKFIKKFNISEGNLLFLGLFCEKTLSFNIIRYFEDTHRKSNENLIKFEFKTKEKDGWPGDSKIYFDSGREVIVDRSVRMQLKKFFQLNRCLFCLDKLNRLADISFGDCYIKGKGDFYGKSNVIIRTKKGEEIFGKYSYLFNLERENIEEIRKAQNLMDKKNNLEYLKAFAKENNIYPFEFKEDNKVAKKLAKLQKYIRWGKEYKVKKIKFMVFLSRMLDKGRTIYRYIR